MRLYSGKVGTIAGDIVKTLTDGKDIETENPREVTADIEAVLNQYLTTEKDATDKAKDAMQSRGIPTSEFARMKKLAAEQMGIKVGDETIDYLLDQILEILMHSANVDEIFSEDVELRRKMAPVLKRHMAVDEELEREVRGKLKHVRRGHPHLGSRVRPHHGRHPAPQGARLIANALSTWSPAAPGSSAPTWSRRSSARGERVRVLDNLATGHWELLKRVGRTTRRSVETITADIRDAEAVARAMDGIEIVFHEAALGSVPRSVENPIESDEVNVHGTVVVLDRARRAGVRRVIFAASSAAYGDTPTLPKQRGHAALADVALRGDQAHLRALPARLRLALRLETLSLRYFNVFGPNQLPDGPYAAAIPRFVRAALTGEPDHDLRRRRADARLLLHRQHGARQPARRRDAQQARRARSSTSPAAGASRSTICCARSAACSASSSTSVTSSRAPATSATRSPTSPAPKSSSATSRWSTWEDGIAPTIEFMRELLERGLS